ncbi:hypothetical protein ACWDQL_34215 [Streptomyces olivaceus]
MADDYLGQDVLLGGLVPSRVAYVIEQGDEAGFRRAVQTASARWGGEGEPIVQLTPSGISETDRSVLAQARVEALVPIGLSAEQEAAVKTESSVRLVAAGLAQDACTRHSYPLTAFTGAEGAMIAQSDGPLWQAAAAGDVAEQWIGEPGLPNLVRSMDGVIGIVQGHWVTLIARTGSQLGVSQAAFNDPLVLWFADSDDPLPDCVAFWNLRALRYRGDGGCRVWLLPADEVDAWADFGDQVRNLLRLEGLRSIDAVLWSHRVGAERLHALAQSWGLVEGSSDLGGPGELPPVREQVGDGGRDLTYTVTSPVPRLTTAWDWARLTDFDAHLFDSPRVTHIRFDAPISLYGQGKALLRLTSRTFAGLPRELAVAQLIHPAATWKKNWLQVPVMTTGEVSLEITLPTPSDALTAVLGGVTEQWELSSKGRVAAALPSEAGGLLLEPGLFSVLSELLTPRAKELVKELERTAREGADLSEQLLLAATWGGRTRRRYRPVSALSGAREQTRLAAERLVAQGWAERGFECVCARCGSSGFVEVEQATAQAVCPGCHVPAQYTGGNDGPVVHYRLNTFIDQAADQGVFPHLMAIATLRAEDSTAFLLPGVDVRLTAGGDLREADVLGLFRGELLAGEVKTSPGDFTAEQIEHDVAISSALGAGYHLMASVHALSESSRTLAEQACAARGLTLLARDGLKDWRREEAAGTAPDRSSPWAALTRGISAKRTPQGTRLTVPASKAAQIARLTSAAAREYPALDFALTFDSGHVHLDIHHTTDQAGTVESLLGTGL